MPRPPNRPVWCSYLLACQPGCRQLLRPPYRFLCHRMYRVFRIMALQQACRPMRRPQRLACATARLLTSAIGFTSPCSSSPSLLAYASASVSISAWALIAHRNLNAFWRPSLLGRQKAFRQVPLPLFVPVFSLRFWLWAVVTCQSAC